MKRFPKIRSFYRDRRQVALETSSLEESYQNRRHRLLWIRSLKHNSLSKDQQIAKMLSKGVFIVFFSLQYISIPGLGPFLGLQKLEYRNLGIWFWHLSLAHAAAWSYHKSHGFRPLVKTLLDYHQHFRRICGLLKIFQTFKNVKNIQIKCHENVLK